MAANGAIRGVSVPGYKARYCAEVVEFMGRGYSLTAFAGEIGVSRAILKRWTETHKPFAVAVERAQARRARVLEDRLLAGQGPAAFGKHMEALKTAAPDEWAPPEPTPAASGPGPVRPSGRRGPRPQALVQLPDNGRG